MFFKIFSRKNFMYIEIIHSFRLKAESTPHIVLTWSCGYMCANVWLDPSLDWARDSNIAGTVH